MVERVAWRSLSASRQGAVRLRQRRKALTWEAWDASAGRGCKLAVRPLPQKYTGLGPGVWERRGARTLVYVISSRAMATIGISPAKWYRKVVRERGAGRGYCLAGSDRRENNGIRGRVLHWLRLPTQGRQFDGESRETVQERVWPPHPQAQQRRGVRGPGQWPGTALEGGYERVPRRGSDGRAGRRIARQPDVRPRGGPTLATGWAALYLSSTTPRNQSSTLGPSTCLAHKKASG